MINIRELQTLLAARGLYKGKIDGLWGARSNAALEELFKQYSKRLPRGWGNWPLADQQQLAIQVLKGGGVFARPDENWGSQQEADRLYGPAGTSQCTSGIVQLPFKMKLSWAPQTLISNFRCHEKVAESATRVYEQIARSYSAQEIETHGFNIFGGCFNFRNKRGGSTLSMHAYGVAIDHDPARNQLRWGRDRAYLAKSECNKFWEAWEAEGWTSLGRRHNFDWMHVQAPKG